MALAMAEWRPIIRRLRVLAETDARTRGDRGGDEALTRNGAVQPQSPASALCCKTNAVPGLARTIRFKVDSVHG